MELLKVAVPVVGIAIILVAAIKRYRAAHTSSGGWLAIITAVWLFITLASRLTLSVLVRRLWLSPATEHTQLALLHRDHLYFSVTSWLWTADEIMFVVFGVALFVAWRVDQTHLTNR